MTTIPILDPSLITDEEAVKAVEREIRLRVSAYPRFVDRGRISLQEAAKELARMKRAHELLLAATAKGRLL